MGSRRMWAWKAERASVSSNSAWSTMQEKLTKRIRSSASATESTSKT